MAQPVSLRLMYLGSVSVKANIKYDASQFITLFPDSTVFILKTKKSNSVPVKVSINASPAFEIEYNEINAYDGVTSLSYVFNQDCIIAVAKELQ